MYEIDSKYIYFFNLSKDKDWTFRIQQGYTIKGITYKNTSAAVIDFDQNGKLVCNFAISILDFFEKNYKLFQLI